MASLLAVHSLSAPDSGASQTVTAVNRAFFLDPDYLPQPSFFSWHGSVTLTPAQPQAILLSSP